MCEFCKGFDFSTVGITKRFNTLEVGLACGGGRFEPDDQFKMCPLCGEPNPKATPVKINNPQGVVRRIDDLGRIVIPKEQRRVLGVAEGDPLEIIIENGCIKIIPAVKCAFCGVGLREHLMEKQEKHICFVCAKEVGEEALGRHDV